MRLLFLVCGVGVCFGLAGHARSDETVKGMQQVVDAWHGETRQEDSQVLRVVYFHPADLEPQAQYRERLQRMIFDIREFLNREMIRIGLDKEKRLPLELDEDDDLVIHLVRGQQPLNGYNYEVSHGQRIREEIRQSLQGTIDLDREFVLVICGLVDRLGDGSWHFRSPYYGWGGSGHRWGLCFAADCEMLDTIHYVSDADFHYREHLGKFSKPLGDFNRLYIGGLAHELGHGLGLPHNGQKPWERRKLGTALMGSGNHTWRGELVNKKGSFLTLASAARLLSHPLFTQSDRGRFRPTIDCNFKALKFVEDDNARFLVSGSLQCDPPAYAVIVDTDLEGRSNYDSHTWVGTVSEAGEFNVPVRYLRAGQNELRLSVCHCNGAVRTEVKIPFQADGEGQADIGHLNASWLWREAERAFLSGDRQEAKTIAERGLAMLAEGDMADRLEHLRNLADGLPEAADPGRIDGKRVSLSRVKWQEAMVGWGEPARDQYCSSNGIKDGVCLLPGGEFHARGLYAHSPSRFVFSLAEKWKQFSATVGLQQGVPGNGSAVFVVLADGKELFRSRVLKGSDTEELQLIVDGVNRLELVVESGKENNHGCWAVWGSPFISR